MTYRVTGSGVIPKSSDFSSLEQAAELAQRLTDQGIENVYVFDHLGRKLGVEKLRRPAFGHTAEQVS